jgi:S-adenosylmethionine:tRNA ribosyltransferase-isomerase
MQIDDFNFSLPGELIAQYPAPERRASRLLELGDTVRDLHFSDLPLLLNAGDLLVFNDTRVIPARLAARKETGGRAEILIERITGANSALAHIRASKTPKVGSKLLLANDVEAVVDGRDGEFFVLTFTEAVLPFLEASGEIPLPPYLNRPAEADDIERYQTVYAKDPGAVAAPTAGLHFDADMLEETRAAGVDHTYVTLHVGAGTFQPLREENISSNRLHSERVRIDAACCDAVNATRAHGGRVIAVGTTSVRALECASASGTIQPFDGETDIFILPGYEFKSVDAMLTNFHLPKSSLLMLVAAFSGTQKIMAAYEHAVREQYRFFSYGDVMFLSPEAGL